MILKREALSQYNTAESPWIIVSHNGKVDIGFKQGEGMKVGLSRAGMFDLVSEWLSSDTGMSNDQRQQLIKKIQK